MLVAYIGNDEVIVCKTKAEEDMLEECFGKKKSDRDIDDYDREEYNDGYVIVSSGGMSVE